MTLSQYRYTILVVVMVLFQLSCSCALAEAFHDRDDPMYIQDEEAGGISSRAHPSYLRTIEDLLFGDADDLETDICGSKMSTFHDEKKLSASAAAIVSVDSFGAKGDGTTDDTKAFEKAWNQACLSRKGAVNFVLSKNKNYLLKQIRFKGPCTSYITMQIYGTIIASTDRSSYSKDPRHWLVVDSVKNLSMEGGGIINGNGEIWWKNSCKINKSLPCKDAPTGLTLYKSENLVVKNLKIKNAQQIHISFEDCVNVQVSGLEVTAPETSPNTDGIHVTGTRNILISTSVIGTGDDCISIESGSSNVRATDITCGPGHGISIGSLGDGNSEAHVSDITVNGAKLFGTTNGVRIKTWQGGSGSASNIKFQNIEMHNVKNPIIIDQNYCDRDGPCKEQGSAVEVRNVVYQNIKGTSASSVAIDFDCSKSSPCQGIVLQEINLVRQDGGKAEAVCKNAKITKTGTVIPQCP